MHDRGHECLCCAGDGSLLPPVARYFRRRADRGAVADRRLYDADIFHSTAICRARIFDNIDLGLANKFRNVCELTRRPVKVTIAGPYFLAKVAYDEHYDDLPRMMADIGKLLRHNFKLLAEAGCKHIQIDEPLFAQGEDEEVQAGIDSINLAIEGLPADIHISAHVCQGNRAIGKEYNAPIGYRYFDVGRYKADLICTIGCSSLLIEHDMVPYYKGLLRDQQLGIGAVDAQDPRVETGETVAERVRAHSWLEPEQTIITSSCAFNHLPRDVVLGKLKAMTTAKRILGG